MPVGCPPDLRSAVPAVTEQFLIMQGHRSHNTSSLDSASFSYLYFYAQLSLT